MKNLKKGFTLIELLVVIAIIAILAGVVLVNVNQARQRARNAAVSAGLAQLRTSLEQDFSASTGYPPDLSGLVNLKANIDNNAASDIVYRRSGTGNTDYIAYAGLNDGEGTYCIDSTGASKAVPSGTTISTTATTCP